MKTRMPRIRVLQQYEVLVCKHCLAPTFEIALMSRGFAACPRSEARERQMFVCLFIGRFSASFQSFGPIFRLLQSQKKLCVVSFAELQLLLENTVLRSSGMLLKHFKSRLLGVFVCVLACPQVPVCFAAHPKPHCKP